MLTVFNDYGNHYYGSGSLTSFLAGTGSSANAACGANQTTYYHNGSYGAWALATAIFNSQNQADPAAPGFYAGQSGSSTTFQRYWDGVSLSSPIECIVNYFGWQNRSDGVSTGGGFPGTSLYNGTGFSYNSTPNPFVGELTNWYTGAVIQYFYIQLFSYNPGNYTGMWMVQIYDLNQSQTGWSNTATSSTGIQSASFITAPGANGGAVNVPAMNGTSAGITVGPTQKAKITLYNPSQGSYFNVYGTNFGGSNSNQYTLP
jgi:hypothetical protein